MPKLRAPRVREEDIERGCIALARAAGADVWKTSQGYRDERTAPGGTRMTPGLSDLILFFRHHRLVVFYEVKTPEGLREHEKYATALGGDRKKLSRARAQAHFRACAQSVGGNVRYGMGGTMDLLDLLVRAGILSSHHPAARLASNDGSLNDASADAIPASA
jgi:hypothetical protein